MVITLSLCFPSTRDCYCFTYTRLSPISFDLEKSRKVREVVEQFKEIGIVPY